MKTKRLIVNPIFGLERLNTATDVRHKRRALSAEEVAKLIESARASGKRIQGFSSEARGRIYLLPYMTGLRKKELASLSPRSFALDTTPPTTNGTTETSGTSTSHTTTHSNNTSDTVGTSSQESESESNGKSSAENETSSKTRTESIEIRGEATIEPHEFRQFPDLASTGRCKGIYGAPTLPMWQVELDANTLRPQYEFPERCREERSKRTPEEDERVSRSVAWDQIDMARLQMDVIPNVPEAPELPRTPKLLTQQDISKPQPTTEASPEGPRDRRGRESCRTYHGSMEGN